MSRFLKAIRVASLGVIMGGGVLLAAAPAPASASAAYCWFCENACPADPLAYCESYSCEASFPGCEAGDWFACQFQIKVQCNMF